ncbi:LacI family DNA-binding transcriptional regulator [Sporosarcina sp. resist]|uniref:LacI family DNA-binding transcriptional regulator n=1 Tax=Sporosarcina sp. resist TaxID=2762563 RepID=UPI00164DFB12|nr:LacI family DNA-binding transcriptional regulator [Sporosarcina sp. resist]QNK87368.1 LacI family DNA-binding transcriptional regulator [Sporosarcina sp. resist]
MANIRDVAKESGVSVATVSRFINQKGYVSKEAKEVIGRAIKELDYKPNLVARSLSTKQTKLIGLIVPDIMNPFFPELARAVEDVALTYDYTVVLCNSDEKAEKEIHYIETLRQKYVAGFIVTTNQLQASHYQNLDIPVVALDRTIDASIPTVSSNNKEGARLGTAHLIEQGCQHIVCMRGPTGLGPADDRLDGFLEAVEGKEIVTHIIECPFHFEQSEEIARKFLSEYKGIDGVFASSDVSAAGVLKAAHSLGIIVPDELQIVGFDGIALGGMLSPGLTTVAQDIYKLGALVTRMLIKLIEEIELEEKEIQVPVKLIIRGTTRSEQ